MERKDDTIRTDSIANVRAAMIAAAKESVQPQPTDIAAKVVPGAPLPGYDMRYSR